MRNPILLALVVVLTWGLRSARAESLWEMNGASCRMSVENFRLKDYATTFGGVQHKGTATSRITMWCPVIATPDVIPPIKYVQSLRFGSERTGTDAAVYTNVEIIAKDLHTGVETIVASTTNQGLAGYGVKCVPAVVDLYTENDGASPHLNFAYYVRIDMVRPVATTQDTFFFVELNDVVTDRICK
ncbi:MAG: hypothetical protein ABI678_05585 [Kofleriaceae bacterium]